ncbi:MAG: preprotein translocase subunit YajC [Senegalia sp. (in: firmicutes)]|uniref:preprotein translocase subunit YajC n=1 Tax=Senegalia sp. (in: firmicutes) TaxID=1924098 RepID=UPI003F952D15
MDILRAFAFPIALLAIFYFLLIRPQQKKDKKVREMRSNLQVGDHIVTIGGIVGIIRKIKEDDITIEVGADKVKFDIKKWAVGNQVNVSANN